LGTWENLWNYAKKEKMDNALFMGIVWKMLETNGCLVYSENLKIATLGVSNLIIVQSPSGVLICDRSRAQQVRQLVMK
jgi:mannose-1-phosphate guanylyltransferase